MSIAPSPAPDLPPLASTFDPAWNLRDLQTHLGGVPLERIRAYPSPGTAVEADLLRLNRKGAPCELIDGVLVEKAVGNFQSNAAMWLAHFLTVYLETYDVGYLLGPDGFTRTGPNQILAPDISFVSWRHFPDRVVPNLLPFAPDLAVEILSDANTTEEIKRKRRDLFAAGMRLMWVVEPDLPAVEVFTSATAGTRLTAADALIGGDVLPGFELSIRDWFQRVIKVQRG